MPFSLSLAALVFLNSASSSFGQSTFIAYEVPANTSQNQTGLGMEPIGMDFEIANDIIISRLGVFDSNGDGFTEGTDLVARIFDRSMDPPLEIISLEFTPEAPGTLVGGSRFKNLDTALRLPTGFLGTISVDGWTDTDSIVNSFNNLANVTWKINDGAGSILFTGKGRYGGGVGDFPPNVDSGPAQRYAAGTFEYQTTPALLPGKPAPVLKPADKQITVTYPAVIVPAPAATYRISRGSSATGPFTQIGETAALSFTDTNVVNGTVYFYKVVGVSAQARVGAESDVKSGAGYTLDKDKQIAYFTPGGLKGTQAYGGSLGMDFDVQNPIIVTRLGVFDENSDGLNLDITARIFNRDTQEIMAELSFTTADPGVLIEGMRFKNLAAPLRLEIGFHGLIEADGYGTGELEINSTGIATNIVWKLNDGSGSILFVGKSRYGSAGAFPENEDGGPAARYAAGTFEFQLTAPQFPGKPQLTAVQPSEDGVVTLNWAAVVNPLPAAKYEILRGSDAVPFAKIAETTSLSFRDLTVKNGTNYCYVVRGIASGGQVGPDSDQVCATPNPRAAGIAYVVPEGLVGNQNLGNGSVGMDFDVAHPIKVTKLGVFDDSSDGITMKLTAVLYDRIARKILAQIDFTPEDQGELVGGSRFKNLPQPIVLDDGFQGSMVIWYSNGNLERLFNTFGRPDPAVADLQAFGGGSLIFVGASRYGSAGGFPGTVDSGPVNRYAGGTFAFEPTTIDRPTFIAYQVAAGSVGNQDLTGAVVGMDFDVANEVILTRLGVFDDGSDGIKEPITVKIWNRAALSAPVITMDFTTDDPGVLIGGSRFKALTRNLHLPRGFQGTVTTDGYGKLERLRNSFGVTTNITWTLNSGDGNSVVFVGKSRYGSAKTYPGSVDGGPAARYAGGTFEFQTTPPAVPGQPQVTVLRPFQDAMVTLSWLSVTSPLPAVKYEILRNTVNTNLAKIGETTNLMYVDATAKNGTNYYYAVRAVEAGGAAGDNSAVVTASPNPKQGGIAYMVKAGLVGNQNLGNGAVGMDFDVVSPIKVTQLGVYDDTSDGIMMSLTAVLYDRTNRTILAQQEFTPEKQGTLIGGSRFLPLAQPLTLAAGFQGSMVIWYSNGTLEKLFNSFGGSPGDNFTTFDGGSILFVGGGRYGSNGSFPGTADGGPANRYAGGTFAFDTISTTAGPAITFSVAAGQLTLTWNGGGTLETSTVVNTGWQTVAGGATGIKVPLNSDKARYYRIRQ